MCKTEVARGRIEAINLRDAALAEALREQRPEACEALYDRYAPGVHRFAVARLEGDVGAAEDVVVETMVAVTRDIRRFHPGRSTLAAWVYGIARRRVLLELRRRRRQKSVPAEVQVSAEEVSHISDGVDLAEGVMSRLDARMQVRALRALLSELEFEALVLSCVEELAAREIAQIMDRSERAVHSILHRAKKKARERLLGDE